MERLLTIQQARQIALDHGNDIKALPNRNLSLTDAIGDLAGYNEIKHNRGMYCRKSLFHALGY